MKSHLCPEVRAHERMLCECRGVATISLRQPNMQAGSLFCIVPSPSTMHILGMQHSLSCLCHKTIEAFTAFLEEVKTKTRFTANLWTQVCWAVLKGRFNKHHTKVCIWLLCTYMWVSACMWVCVWLVGTSIGFISAFPRISFQLKFSMHHSRVVYLVKYCNWF